MNNRQNSIRFNLSFWVLYFLYEWLGMGAATDQYYVYFLKACTSFSDSLCGVVFINSFVI